MHTEREMERADYLRDEMKDREIERIAAEEDQALRRSVADICGWEQPNVREGFIWSPYSRGMIEADPLTDYNTMRQAECVMGLHHRDNLADRVRWINNLRAEVSKTCPKNKIGTPIVSDVDLLNATARQRAVAFVKTFSKPVRAAS